MIDPAVQRLVSLGPLRDDGTYALPSGLDPREFPVVDVPSRAARRRSRPLGRQPPAWRAPVLMAGPGGGGRCPGSAWFRRDLRLADPSDVYCSPRRDGADVVALFVVDPALTVPAGVHRLGFLAGCLDEVGPYTGGARSWSVTATPPRCCSAAAGEPGARVVLAADDAGPYGRRKDCTGGRPPAVGGWRVPREARPPAGRRATGDALDAVGTPFAAST